MRVGFDVLAIQSPYHGTRGIGRYSRQLLSAMVARGEEHEYFLYAQADLPTYRIPLTQRTTLRTLRVDPERGESCISQRMDRLARHNPDALDVLIVLSPFEHWSYYAPPARALNGLKLAAVVYDMIPFLFPSEEPTPKQSAAYRALEELRRYDRWLAISESTRRDCLSLLGSLDDRVVNISAASAPGYFLPPAGGRQGAAEQAINRLGITRPFILNVGGLDERKNTAGLIAAYALLPERLRRSHQLVLTFHTNPWGNELVRELARSAGLGEPFFYPAAVGDGRGRGKAAREPANIVVTNEVSDVTLRVLYQQCAAFAFPSLYEGFGLPLLEAMHCGAPVVAGNNSSQVEVVGGAGLLANAADPADIAAKLALILDDQALAADLRRRAVDQAATFHWDQTADRAWAALTAAIDGPRVRRAPTARRSRTPRPRIAFFSPFPPMKSGVADYAVNLVSALSSTYDIDLYHDTGYVPQPALRAPDVMACDARLFPRNAAVRNYHAAVYQMGNSRFHTFLYELMLRVPGVVTLHDFCLAGFHLHYGHVRGMDRDYIRNELLFWYPEQRREIVATLKSLPWDWEIIARECARRGWFLNRRLLDASRRVVVHSPWCVERIHESSPEYADQVDLIPHGASVRVISLEERASVRARFGIPQSSLVVASFGFVHPDKMGPEAIDAFRALAATVPSALFLFVGEEADGGFTRKHAGDAGVLDRVRFLGRQNAADFLDLIAVTDIGINLRRPPTNGETSGALLHLLAAGIPTIVSDVATFHDYPECAVRKVGFDSDATDGLRRAMFELATRAELREALGCSAVAYSRAQHDWPKVAQSYVDAIERSREPSSAPTRLAAERMQTESPSRKPTARGSRRTSVPHEREVA